MALDIATPDDRTEYEDVDMDALSGDKKRAIRARTETMVVVPQTDADGICVGMYDVYSQSGSHYTVILDYEGGCDCPDTEFHHARNCKHRRRVAIQISESECPAPDEHIGEYAETLDEIRAELERERSRILGDLDTVGSLLDCFDA